jgi:hypothetical protein
MITRPMLEYLRGGILEYALPLARLNLRDLGKRLEALA